MCTDGTALLPIRHHVNTKYRPGVSSIQGHQQMAANHLLLNTQRRPRWQDGYVGLGDPFRIPNPGTWWRRPLKTKIQQRSSHHNGATQFWIPTNSLGGPAGLAGPCPLMHPHILVDVMHVLLGKDPCRLVAVPVNGHEPGHVVLVYLSYPRPSKSRSDGSLSTLHVPSSQQVLQNTV